MTLTVNNAANGNKGINRMIIESNHNSVDVVRCKECGAPAAMYISTDRTLFGKIILEFVVCPNQECDNFNLETWDSNEHFRENTAKFEVETLTNQQLNELQKEYPYLKR